MGAPLSLLCMCTSSEMLTPSCPPKEPEGGVARADNPALELLTNPQELCGNSLDFLISIPVFPRRILIFS